MPLPSRPRWRARPAGALALLLVVAFLTARPAVAGAPDSPAPTSRTATGTIRLQGSQRCLGVARSTHTDGAPAAVAGCGGGARQRWAMSAAGLLQAGPTQEARCLSVDAPVQAHSRVRTARCGRGAVRQWGIAHDGGIRELSTGLCLTAVGTALRLATCRGARAQRWPTDVRNPDVRAPGAPSDPRAGDLTCTGVTLSWGQARDDHALVFYDVFHDGQLMTSVPARRLSTHLDVVPRAHWGLYVDARDAAGNVSQASATVHIDAPPCADDTEPPTSPTGLTATASGTSADLTWGAATDDTGVKAYDVLRDGEKVGSVATTSSAPPATRFTDTGLAPATTYSYAVVARDAAGNVSDPSDAVQVTTGAACTGPVCEVSRVGTDTDIPWGLTTLPDGSLLYSRRDAHDLVRLDPATGAKTDVGTVPGVDETDGEGGLLGIAVGPDFSLDADGDHWVYVMHTSPTDNRIVRIQLVDDALQPATEQVLLSGIARNKFHNGGRLRFGPDGDLYASTGDAQNGDNAQNTSSLNGKILRIAPDGSIPADNPFGNAVWSYGHRNPQGLAFDSRGRLWEQEFGNATMDETNLIVRGGDYGWPACEGTSGTCDTPGYRAPAHTYPVSDGSCSGITIVRDALYVACERGARLYREVISGSTLTDVEQFFVGTYGRLRTVEPAPDGGLWLTTTNQGDKDSIADNSDEQILHVRLN